MFVLGMRSAPHLKAPINLCRLVRVAHARRIDCMASSFVAGAHSESRTHNLLAMRKVFYPELNYVGIFDRGGKPELELLPEFTQGLRPLFVPLSMVLLYHNSTKKSNRPASKSAYLRCFSTIKLCAVCIFLLTIRREFCANRAAAHARASTL